MKKNFKLVLALVLSIMMVLGSFAALADTIPGSDAIGATSVQRYNNETGNLDADALLTIGGLEVGDTVEYYQIVKFDATAKATKGWVLIPELATALGSDAAGILNDIIAGTISYEDANKIAAQLEKAVKKTPTNATVGADKTWTQTVARDEANAGLYMAIITAAKAGVIYNPVLLGVDYYQNESAIITLTDNAASYKPQTVAKKQVITLKKEADAIVEVPVGQDVHFDVETLMPKYPANYTNPVFTLTDTMSAGLELKGDPAVYLVSKADYVAADPKPAALSATNYTLTKTTNGWTIAFKADYIKGITAATNIYVKYTATITGDVPYSVNPEENTIVLDYSNGPDSVKDHGHLKDITNHYTFDIDGQLFGQPGYSVTEIVKIGLDSDGNEIYQSTTLSNTGKIGALKNAEFTLSHATGTKNPATATWTAYTNAYNTSSTIVSEADGRFDIRGLAADYKDPDTGHYFGLYKLEETKAPAGYVKDSNPYYIVIEAVIDSKTVTETDSDGCVITYDAEYLKSYSVTVNGHETASFTLTNRQSDSSYEGYLRALSSTAGDTVVGMNGPITSTSTSDSAATFGKIQNTQGVELPSTGGIGTTIFYIGGSLMVLAAAILLITKRRMGAED